MTPLIIALRNAIRRAKRRWFQIRGLEPASRAQVKRCYEFIGSDYGGWPLIAEMLNNHSVVYSAGVGNDVSFDIGLIRRFGCHVHAFDPTPKSIAWIRNQRLPANFHFHPYGLGSEDSIIPFRTPPNANHVSFSPVMSDSNADFIWAPVRRLDTLTDCLSHQHVDLLKMDIEGGEYDVIADLAVSHSLPGQLLVEFHHRLYGISRQATVNALQTLAELEYKIFYISPLGREYGFVR